MLHTFTLPTTGAVTLASSFRCDYHQMLVNADAARSSVRDALKRAKRTDQPDYLSVVKAIEQYLPFVATLSDHAHEIDTIDFKCNWKLLTPGKKLDKLDQKHQVASYEFERGMVLLTYALALMNLSARVVTQDSENKWKLASSYLLKAESVLLHLSQTPPNLDNTPLDLSTTTLTQLIAICQGASHLLILQKSEQSTSPSPSLLSRVAIYAAEKLQFAQNIRFDSDLEKWLQVAHSYCVASAQRYMAMDQAKNNQVGQAIAHLQAAENTIALKKTRPTLNKAQILVALRQIISQQMIQYKAENDRLTFQKVPKLDELQTWPSGRPVTSISQPWVPPPSLITGKSSSSSSADEPAANTSSSSYY